MNRIDPEHTYLIPTDIRDTHKRELRVSALKPIDDFLVILSHPVEIVLGPVDRLLSGTRRVGQQIRPLVSEFNQLIQNKYNNKVPSTKTIVDSYAPLSIPHQC